MHFLYLIVLTLPVAGFFIREPEIDNYMCVNARKHHCTRFSP